MAIRTAFYNLLNTYAKQKGFMLVPEVTVMGEKGKKVTPDGTLKDSLRQDWGYWESKDEADDIDEEIDKKFRKGCPRDNILFEDSRTCVLIQNGNETTEIKPTHPPTSWPIETIITAIFLFLSIRNFMTRNKIDET